MKKILSAVSASAIAVTGIAGAMFNSNASQNATVNRYMIDQVDAGIIKISRMVLSTDIQ